MKAKITLFLFSLIFFGNVFSGNIKDISGKRVFLNNNTGSTLNVDFNIYADSTGWATALFDDGVTIPTGLSSDILGYPIAVTSGTLDIIQVSGITDNCELTVDQDNANSTITCTGAFVGNAINIGGKLYVTIS